MSLMERIATTIGQSVMERIATIIGQLVECGDIEVEMYQGHTSIYVQDFQGFDWDWNEIERELVHPDLVDELERLIENYGLETFSIKYESDEI